MKTTTLLALFSVCVSYAQTPTTALDYISDGATQAIVIAQNSTGTQARSEQQNVTLFTDFDSFSSNCEDNDVLTFEDFAGGPVNPTAGVMGCESIISSAGGECFPADEIQADVEFTNSTAAGGGTMIFFDGTTFGIDNPGVGANSFAAFTIVNFTGDTPVTSVGFNLHSPLGDGPIDLRVFGENNELLETNTYDATSDAQFVGIISEDPIDRIELENLEGTIVELVTQFFFGNCEVLSIDDTSLQDVSIYPNPAKDIVNITSSQGIDNIAIYNLLGQKVATYTISGQNSSIDLQALSAGAYILEVAANNQKSTYKLIKE